MSNVYRGPMPAFGSLRAAAEAQEPQPDADMPDVQDPNAVVRLEGETGQAGGFGSRAGDAVPNLAVTKVGGHGGTTRAFPPDIATDQSVFTAANPRRRQAGR
jgi:hypothetical protein